MRRGFITLASVFAPFALAFPARAEPGPPCEGPQRFDGLALEPGDATVFDPAWRPRLRALAVCLERAPRSTCLAVQGHFDDQQFPPEVVRALGGELAAQTARAQSRAARALSELASLGVPAQRLVERPPGLAPTYRGVELVLVPECVAVPPVPDAPEARPRVEPDQGAAGARRESSVVERIVVVREREREREPRISDETGDRTPLHFVGEQGVSLFAVHSRGVLGAVTRAGLTWLEPRWYAGATLGGVFAVETGHDVAFEAQVSAGHRVLRHVSLGAFMSYRVASNSAASAWLEQGMAAGMEGTQCFLEPWSGASLCARESVGVGVGWRRVAPAGDDVRLLDAQERDSLLLAAAGVLFTQRL